MAGEKHLGEVAEIIMGQSPPGETYNESGIGLPFFQGVADFNYRNPTPRVFCSAPSRIAEPGDILLSVRAPIGRVNIADRKCAIGRGLSIIRAKTAQDARYLEFVLRTIEHSWAAIEGSGSVFGNATKKDLETLIIPWWEDAAYRFSIAHILGTLDDKIELNRRMNETLEQMARALFKSWFVDFEPVRAKSEVRQQHPKWRNEQVSRAACPNLNPEIAALFPDAFEDSELGEIPKGWRVGRIKDCCSLIQNGGTPSRKEPRFWEDGTVPWLTSAEVRQPIIITTENFITEAGLNESSAKWVTPLSTVVALYGATAGQVALVSSRLTTNQAVCALAPRKNFEFFNYLWMRSATPDLQNKAVGSAQQNISKAIVEDTCVLFAQEVVLEKFNYIVKPLFVRWITNLFESRTLADLRDALLPKLISGEIRLKDAEQFLKERGL